MVRVILLSLLFVSAWGCRDDPPIDSEEARGLVRRSSEKLGNASVTELQEIAAETRVDWGKDSQAGNCEPSGGQIEASGEIYEVSGQFHEASEQINETSGQFESSEEQDINIFLKGQLQGITDNIHMGKNVHIPYEDPVNRTRMELIRRAGKGRKGSKIGYGLPTAKANSSLWDIVLKDNKTGVAPESFDMELNVTTGSHNKHHKVMSLAGLLRGEERIKRFTYDMWDPSHPLWQKSSHEGSEIMAPVANEDDARGERSRRYTATDLWSEAHNAAEKEARARSGDEATGANGREAAGSSSDGNDLISGDNRDEPCPWRRRIEGEPCREIQSPDDQEASAQQNRSPDEL